MNDIKKMIEVMQAYADGKQIQIKGRDYKDDYWTDWKYRKSPSWNWPEYDYRIKPKVPTKKVKRYEIYNGEFVKAFKDFTRWFVEKNTNCEECLYDCEFFNYSCRPYCFAQWLEEEIEVEEC